MSQFCTNCGAPLPDDAKFCEACGAKVEPEEVVTEQSYTEEPAKAKPPVQEESYNSGRPSGPAFTPQTGRPAPNAPSGPSGSGGGIPKAALIGGIAVVAVAAVVGSFVLRGKKDDGG